MALTAPSAWKASDSRRQACLTSKGCWQTWHAVWRTLHSQPDRSVPSLPKAERQHHAAGGGNGVLTLLPWQSCPAVCAALLRLVLLDVAAFLVPVEAGAPQNVREAVLLLL